jgi:uncharacterized protein involved in cysteine biosynthesis
MVTRSKSDRLCRIDRTKYTRAHVVTVLDTALCQFHFEFKFLIYMIFKGLETIYRNLQPFTGKAKACSKGVIFFCNLICQIYVEFPLHVFIFNFFSTAEKQRQHSRYSQYATG